jgi:hypothetical protein
MGCNNIRRGGGGGMGGRCVGAKLDDNELHDDLQFASRDLSVGVFRAGGTVARLDHAAAAGSAAARRQHRGEHDVRDELHHHAGQLPDRLC